MLLDTVLATCMSKMNFDEDLWFDQFILQNSFAPIISELANAGKVDQALEIYPELKENGIQPPPSVVCPLVDALCREKRLDEAVKYFKGLLVSYFNFIPFCSADLSCF